jgi:hypothetical protein
MTIDRRTVIVGGMAAVGGAVCGAALPLPAAGAPTSPYPQNRAPLRPAAFLRLPPGAVRPAGWVTTQLSRQVNGLCGRYPDISHFLQFGNTGWTNRDLGGWEEVPYWLRGYVDLAYVTGDSGALSTASRWIEAVLSTRAADGFFGPSALRTSLNGHADFWPHMPMLHALRSFADRTGDGRINGFLTGFFGFMSGQPNAVFSDGWGRWRWADTIDVIFWLYNRTGDGSLLDLVRRIHQYSADWRTGLPTPHNVNIAQGFREPAQYWLLSGNDADRRATYDRYDQVQGGYGQFPGGGFSGDENLRPTYADARQGFETCGIVEYMMSHEILTRLTGDPVWADRVEELAFNSLPAALDPTGRAVHYITSANCVDLDNRTKTKGQFQNNFPMQSYRPGVDQYRCCPHNYGMGWPYFTEEMWLATPDGGLCASLYGPCTVTALVADGRQVTVVESTTYPFGDTVTLRIATAGTVSFPLVLRIPRWCTAPELRVNGAPVGGVGGGPRYAELRRAWTNGDVVTLRMPMSPVWQTWPHQHNAASISYGPLTFSLRIQENWTQTGGTAQFPEYDVHAGSLWNYGLVPQSTVTVVTGGDATDPYSTGTAPVRLRLAAQRIDRWTTDVENVVTPLRDGPVASTAPVEQVELIPMGAARLRITAFPVTGGAQPWPRSAAMFRVQNRNSGKVLGVSGMSIDNSANVVQFTDNGTSDHLWRIVDAGGGYVKIQNANSGRLLAVEGASVTNSARLQQFDDNGTADHLWQLVDRGDGWLGIRNRNSGKVAGVDVMSTADSAQVVQFDDSGTADHDWRIIPDGPVRIQNVNSGKLLAVEGMSTANSARVQQFSDVGSADHVWTFVPDGDGWFRIRNQNSGKVLGVDLMSTANSAQVVQFDDNGTADHQWRIRVTTGSPGIMRIQNRNSGKVLAVHDMSTADSANVEQFDDNGSADHDWRLLSGA